MLAELNMYVLGEASGLIGDCRQHCSSVVAWCCTALARDEGLVESGGGV